MVYLSGEARQTANLLLSSKYKSVVYAYSLGIKKPTLINSKPVLELDCSMIKNLAQAFTLKSKPLFKKHAIMTVHNQYYYHTVNETLKILKHRTPISLHSLFTLSKRPGKETLLILPLPSDSFVYRSSYLWNHARSKFIYADFSKPASSFKSSIKKIIFAAQNLGEPENWCEQQNFLNYSG